VRSCRVHKESVKQGAAAVGLSIEGKQSKPRKAKEKSWILSAIGQYYAIAIAVGVA
jgi:hypothetical protein